MAIRRIVPHWLAGGIGCGADVDLVYLSAVFGEAIRKNRKIARRILIAKKISAGRIHLVQHLELSQVKFSTGPVGLGGLDLRDKAIGKK